MDSAEPLYGLRLLLDTQLLQHTKNQLHIDEPYFERQLDKVAQIEQLPVGALRWAQLFIAVSYGERDAKKLLTALKLPNRLQHEVEHLLMIHKMLQQAGESKAQWIFAVLATSRESAEAYLKLVPKNKVDEYSKWLKTMGATSVAELHISGNQVIELGVRRGPEVGRLLQELLEKVALGELVNEPNALIRMAKQLGERR
jgi:tRNA nucleotidyltransferase (CCA-adding enzyme)